MINPMKVACYFINRFNKEDEKLELPKLNKLLYYSQAWYLVIYNKRLMDIKFQAWMTGPINPEIFHKLKKFNIFIDEDEGYGIKLNCNKPKLSKKVENFLDNVFDVYGKHSEQYLELLVSHECPFIWAEDGFEPPYKEISERDMKLFYTMIYRRDNSDEEKDKEGK